MAHPRFTVITPSYNQGQFLERAMCSVLDQGYPNLEYMVVDGGSWDESPRIIRHYAHRLAWTSIERDFGAAHAINKALRRATGEFIAIVNSDDLLLAGALYDAVHYMNEAGVDWAAGNALRIDERDNMLGELHASAPSSTAAFVMHDSGYLPSSATFYRRSLFERHGLFDAHLQRAYTFEFGCRLLLAGIKPHILSGYYAARREHANNRSAVQAVEQGLEMVEASLRYAERLAPAQRLAARVNCHQRRRIFTRAAAELAARRAA